MELWKKGVRQTASEHRGELVYQDVCFDVRFTQQANIIYTACRLCSLLPAICLDVCLTISAFCPSRHLLSNFEIYTINIMIPMIINQVLK